MLAATPGWWRTPSSVIIASEVEWVTAVIRGRSAWSMFSPSCTTTVPGVSSKEERQWIRTPWLRAYSTERSCSTPAPRGRHLEHLLEGDGGELARVGHHAWVGAEHARHVGVDFAHLRAKRRRHGDRGRVRAATPQRGDVLGGSRHSLEARHQHDVVLLQRRSDAIGAHVEDARAGVRGVGDDPRLRARQRDRAVAEVVDRHRAQRAGDALPGGQQHVHLARVRARRRPPPPSRSARRWSCRAPRAPPPRVRPPSRRSTMRRAARLIRSASATEVPPNFITTMLDTHAG